MRKIVVAVAGTISGLIILISYHTSLGAAGTVGSTSLPVGTATPGATSSSSATAPGGTATSMVTGPTVQTRWGPVQVQIKVSDGEITDVTAVQYPTGNQRDQVINDHALPVLAQEALAAQSAQIDHVSGATVTSEGYVQSLQSALDQANL